MGAFFAGIGVSSIFFLLLFFLWHRRIASRIKELTEYLEKINVGGKGLILSTAEDEFSILQDEMYKTVTMLYQTRDAAVAAKNNFADNLSNIAHQLKTPITSISLSAQMLQRERSGKYSEQIQKQLVRMTRLEETLLLLARIDAGTITFDKKEVDVFTLLMLAADNLETLFSEVNAAVDIPETGEILVWADMEWTMEAVMNLFKNCLEHTPVGGTVHCFYTQNPIYTEIQIWDEGEGFEKEDISHLFERFYRGKNAKGNGMGIGLALAREIVESQNGTICAKNMKNGGACFEIRFYCH